MKTDTRTPAEILRAAKARIEDPAHWTRGALARSARGMALRSARSRRARAWCASGAVRAETDQETIPPLLWAVARRLFDMPLVIVNDHLGHAASLAVYDAAIAAAEAAEAGR